MADYSKLPGGPKSPYPNTTRNAFSVPGISVDEGNVVSSTTDGQIQFANAAAADTSNVIGLARSANEEAPVDVTYAGPFTLTTAQWDAVTGQSGGLTPQAKYYLSPTTAGHLTTTKPTAGGNFAVYLGFALSSTTLMINIGEPNGPLS